MSAAAYRVVVEKEYLKFSAAHFIAYKGFREPLHGHNYQVSVAISGAVGPDGYVLDFGIVKQLTKEVCAELDERVLVPAKSDCLTIARVRHAAQSGVDVPLADCVIIGDTPLDHAAAVANEMPAVLMATGRIPYDELAGLAPAAVFADWSDAPAIRRALEEIP